MKNYGGILNKTGILLGLLLIVQGCGNTVDKEQASYDGNISSDKPVEGIISLCKFPIPYIILALEGNDHKLIGINPATKKAMQSKVLNKYFPNFQNISDKVCNQGFTPNIEEIVKLGPDVIFTWKIHSETINQMRQFGLNVVGVHYDGTDNNDKEMITMIAQALGQQEKADSMLRWRSQIIEDIKSKSDAIPEAQRPNVIFFYDYNRLTVGGEDCYENFCINLVGGNNLGAGLGLDQDVNIEQILAWNPDIILIGEWQDFITPEAVYNDPLLQDVKAIQQKRVYKMPQWASNASPLTWMWLAEVFHPELYDYALKEEIQSVYKWQYGIDLKEQDIEEVLIIDENAKSPNYFNFK